MNTEKIQELQSKIQHNCNVRDKAIEMRRLLRDHNAISQCETQITECERYIEYFTEELRKLRARSSGGALSADTSEKSPESPESSVDRATRKYSNLDLLTFETPYNKAKVSLKLHELEYRCDMERKLLSGIKNMADVLQRDPTMSDRRRRSEVDGQRYESLAKLNLLNGALRKYKDLYIDDEDDDIELDTPATARLPPGFRLPVTGRFRFQVMEARKLSHAPTSQFRIRDTVVHVKVDSNVVFRSRPSRIDKWVEDCEVLVNKASEMEVEIFDQAGDRRLLIGVLWIKLTDIAEAIRKRKAQHQERGWVPADVAQQTQPVVSPEPSASASRLGTPPVEPTDSEGIAAWFDVEPMGQIALKLNFVRDTATRRPFDKLNRAGAVRQRREQVIEMNGHHFVAKKLYNIMKCALCGDFLVNSGYQCDDCVYTCHKKCYAKVVTKCITMSEHQVDPDEERLNHRIPHRFEPITNIGPNWCCHCGYVLPLGSRKARKCSECNVTCHTKCAHLVPDFCGLTMEMANQMLAEIKAAKRRTIDNAILKPTLTPEKDHDEDADSLSVQVSDLAISPSTATPSAAGKGVPTLRMPPPGHRTSPAPEEPETLPPLPDSSPSQDVDLMMPPTMLDDDVPTRRFTLEDFYFMAVLGRGNFGKVMLASERTDSEKLYAIKVLKKRTVIDSGEIEGVQSEKRMFLMATRSRHPFLVGLHSCFQTPTRIYFVMEYVSGGDLMRHIQMEPFSERRAKFYACEVLLALEYLHSLGIIYRDLKLDNIMLCTDGHIKLTDYGLCKDNMWYGSTTDTFCGTLEFMAPEILLDIRYGRAVDWWAFGVLLYEMLLGQCPFRGEDEEEMTNAIVQDEVLYPLNMSRHSVSICQRLLNRDPARRLGSGERDAEEIKEHPFFNGVDWESILAKRVPPPFYPTVNHSTDTSNFDEEFTNERPALTPVEHALTADEQQEFEAFSYTARWAVE